MGSSYSLAELLNKDNHNLPKSYSPAKDIEPDEASPNEGKESLFCELAKTPNKENKIKNKIFFHIK